MPYSSTVGYLSQAQSAARRRDCNLLASGDGRREGAGWTGWAMSRSTAQSTAIQRQYVRGCWSHRYVKVDLKTQALVKPPEGIDDRDSWLMSEYSAEQIHSYPGWLLAGVRLPLLLSYQAIVRAWRWRRNGGDGDSGEMDSAEEEEREKRRGRRRGGRGG